MIQILGNYYTDFQTDGAVVPYIGAGAGLFLIQFDDGVDTLKSTNLGYHFDVGVGINTSDSMMFDVGFRYTSTLSQPSDTFGGVEFEYDYANTTIMIGVRMDL
jgi:opacity protein-like surface antigen